MADDIHAGLMHERTLHGAIDSYLGALVRVQPQLRASYGTVLEDFAARWIEAGQPNSIELISSDWISTYLATAGDLQHATAALRSFFSWSSAEQLCATNPMRVP